MRIFAAEYSPERDEILENACIVFPEYAVKIAADTMPVTPYRSFVQRELVHTETRALSDSEFIVYTEYSDGLIVLDQVTMEEEVIYHGTSDIANEIKVDITVKATCSATTAYFEVSNIKFTIDEYYFDHIDSIGSPAVHNPTNTYNDMCTYTGNYTLTSTETASKKASVVYPLSFRFAPYPTSIYTSFLWVEVGNNSLSVHHDLW